MAAGAVPRPERPGTAIEGVRVRRLRLVGPSEDGAFLVVELPSGERFQLPIDERLRAAARGDLSRLGQLEIDNGTLRPRDIQFRVRAGESAEQVAASAGVSLERVLRFAYPVLQERQRVVAQARGTRIRRAGAPPAETLDELVNERLVGRGTEAATLIWDAWRREDGSWAVCLRWQGVREYSASWTLDLAGRTLHADDPAAEQLIAAEFHLRTITPVTPLAALAQLTTEPDRADAEPADTVRPAPRPPTAGPPTAGPAAGRPAARPAAGAGARTSTESADRSTRSATGAAARTAAEPSDRPTTAPGQAAAAGTPADAPGRPAASTTARRIAEAAAKPEPRAGIRRAPAAVEPAEPGPSSAHPARRRAPAVPAVMRAVPDEPAASDQDDEESPAVLDGQTTLPIADGTGHDDPDEQEPDEDGEPGRRAHVPSWDDILLGVRRRH
jgi:hypothetical protein